MNELLEEPKTAPLYVAQPLAPYTVRVHLVPRERRLLELLAEGCTNAQIGAQLHRSEKTVRNQLTVLYRKLDVANRAEAVSRYLTHYPQPPKGNGA